MQPDSYWRTRSIAEAMQEGYTHLRVTCPSCGRTTDLPWPLLIGRKGTNRNTFLGNIPLRCHRCGNATPIIACGTNSKSYNRLRYFSNIDVD
jgi:hypothetical protein